MYMTSRNEDILWQILILVSILTGVIIAGYIVICLLADHYNELEEQEGENDKITYE